MVLLVVSFVAGMLTALAPCVLPLLPIIIGGSVQGGGKRNPYIITASLAAAIVLFTLLLKFSTLFINIPEFVWSLISGTIIIAFGLTSLFPQVWGKINATFHFGAESDKLLAESVKVKSGWGDVLIGLSLGPVFSSCSPTYFLILATVLPRSFAVGMAYLIAYAAGLSLVLLLISVLGQRFIKNARWAANPNGWFKRGLGVLFILVGIVILTGNDKRLQTYIIENSSFSVTKVEQSLLQNINKSNTVSSSTTSAPTVGKNYPRYQEIVNPSGFVNSNSVTLESLVGKKVILVDFMTYSCINCIRTFPYLNAWYDKYKDQGLEIVAIHTPEFAFEKKIENVRKAMTRYGITFPVVLDNDYATWNAYGNNYWPRKYLIDIDGYIVYDHIGEGKYDQTETKIQELLKEKTLKENTQAQTVSGGYVRPTGTMIFGANSPETYFGSDRNDLLANGKAGISGVQNFAAPVSVILNKLYLVGKWNFEKEYTQNTSAQAKIIYHYDAHSVYLVTSATSTVKVRVLRDGKPLEQAFAGSDILFENGQSYLLIKEERLYTIISDDASGDHVLEFIIEGPGLKAYAFTFG